MMDANTVVTLLKEVGLRRLIYFDGCCCGGCHVAGVSIDVGCWNGSEPFYGMTVRVHSGEMGTLPKEYHLVAREVARQVHEMVPWHDLIVRYCDYGTDAKNRCVYCGKPRASADDYLCSKCQTRSDGGSYVGMSVAEEYDYKSIAISISAQEDG
jgi:hypothetical protein